MRPGGVDSAAIDTPRELTCWTSNMHSIDINIHNTATSAHPTHRKALSNDTIHLGPKAQSQKPNLKLGPSGSPKLLVLSIYCYIYVNAEDVAILNWCLHVYAKHVTWDIPGPTSVTGHWVHCALYTGKAGSACSLCTGCTGKPGKQGPRPRQDPSSPLLSICGPVMLSALSLGCAV